jgi:hypothetical protein
MDKTTDQAATEGEEVIHHHLCKVTAYQETAID